jgi:sugar phosphate isomerase/epimerase
MCCYSGIIDFLGPKIQINPYTMKSHKLARFFYIYTWGFWGRIIQINYKVTQYYPLKTKQIMADRREFLKKSGALALGGILLPNIMRGNLVNMHAVQHDIGIQVYSTNSFMKDPKAVFEQLAKIGFKNIETAFSPIGPYYGMKPKDLHDMINGLGMQWISHHVGGVPLSEMMAPPKNPTPDQAKQIEQMKKMPQLQNIKFPNLKENMQQLVDEAAEGGLQYLVCAATVIRNKAEIDQAVEMFTQAGELCKKAGLQFAYHNHATEWDPVGAATAGKNPVDLFKGQPGRFPLWHVKDFDLATKTIEPIGKGTIDFKPTFAKAELAGMKYFFYEQDNAKSMDDVRMSYNNLRKIV